MSASVVEYFRENEGYKCGYCKNESSRYSNGMWGHVMTPLDYQDLIDRGWRRSGQYCYKPINNKSCCPMYTIRCAALNFKPSKSQKKILRKFKNFIENDKKPSCDKADRSSEDAAAASNIMDDSVIHIQRNSRTEELSTALNLKQAKQTDLEKVLEKDIDVKGKHVIKEITSILKETKGASDLSDCKETSNLPPSKGVSELPAPSARQEGRIKGKLFRRERWRQKQAEKGMVVEQKPGNQERTLEDWLDYKDGAHSFEVRLVPADPEDEDFSSTFNESLSVYQRYQVAVHGDSIEKCSASQFKRFLCKNPLTWEDPYGAFHRHFLVDGKIVAVGVVDILPNCVSSVYLYYDPDYSFLSLGTYTSLNEIAFVRQLQTMLPSLQFYYMGFYIHSCQKMRYKGQFSPSYLCCPETYTWQGMERCRSLLDGSAYSRLDPDPANLDANRLTSVNDVKVLFCKLMRQSMVWKDYVAVTEREDEEEEALEYGTLVGRILASRMLLYRPSST